jgi:hypothetical protein
MSLDNIDPTVEDFQQTDWQSVTAESETKTCDAYQALFHAKANDASSSDDASAQQVFELLSHICTLRLRLDTPNTPYVPGIAFFSNWRSADIGDFTVSHLDTLQAVLPDIADAELKARIADILWVRKHGDYQSAQTAVRSYLESAQTLEHPEHWVECAHRIERALQIASQLGKRTAVFQETIDHIEATLDKYQGEDPLFLSAHLMELLLNTKQGDPNKYIALSEKAATLAESASDGLKWHRARTYWTINARWYLRNDDEESNHNALVQAAETYVREAEDALQNPSQSYPVASYYIQHAIEAYRRIKGTETRRKDLHKFLIDYQKESVENLQPLSFSFDISNFVEEATDLVKGKTLHEALVALALYCSSPKTNSLRKRIEDYARQFGLSFWLPTNLIDDSGKTKGKRPGIGEDHDSEATIRAEMFREAQREQGLFAEAVVHPAMIQINAEHHFREPDFLPIVVDNPFVPCGREMIFARGLYAGLTGDMLVSSHILLPQVENSLRYILEQHGYIVSGLDKNQIQDEYPLSKMLHEHRSELQEILGEDLLFDLEGLLTERFGSNLRNLVAHGLLDGYEFTSRQMLYLWWLTLRLCCLPIYTRFHRAPDDNASTEKNLQGEERPDLSDDARNQGRAGTRHPAKP